MSASFPQIYSNNKKGRESDLSDSKKIMKKHKQKSNNFCLCYYEKDGENQRKANWILKD